LGRLRGASIATSAGLEFRISSKISASVYRIFVWIRFPMRMQNPVGRRSIAARSSPTKQRKLFRLDFFMESPLVHYPFRMGMISPGLRRFL
jgi:hypothetical protein